MRAFAQLTCTAALAVVFAASAVLPGTASAHPPNLHRRADQQRIYFFANPGISVEKDNPLVIRPAGWPLFQDGQWVLEKLHWTGWGSSIAHAKGLSSSSNGIPNAAEGKRIITSARVTLSKPVRFRGHEVYSCFRLKVPPPAHYPFSCLQRLKGGYVGFTSPGTGTPIGADESAPGTRHLTDFLSPDRKVWCLVGAGYTFCVAGGSPAARGPEHSATIERNGQVRLCSVQVPSLAEQCTQNWDVHSPVLHYGERNEAEGIRCTSAPNGITCVKVSGPGKGKGFRVNKDEAVRVTAGVASGAAHHHRQVDRVGRHLTKSSTSHAPLWAALGGKVICGLSIHLPEAPAELLCAARSIPAPKHTGSAEGDPGFVFLQSVGNPRLARLSQYSWETEDGWDSRHRPELKAGQKWTSEAIEATCTVRANAVRCANASGHGFKIKGRSYRAF